MTQKAEAPAASDLYVQSLARGLAVIRAFDAEHPAMTLSEVAARTDLTRATARRFLHTLVELGYMRTDGKKFSLSATVLHLGYSYLSALTVPQLAQPHLEALSEKLGESTSAAVLEGPEIVYVGRVATRRIMNIGITVGTRFPAYATSMGRVLLAGLEPETLQAYLSGVEFSPLTPHTLNSPKELLSVLNQVRAQGWCVVDQELELGLMSVAAPVRDAAGHVIAAANVSFQSSTLQAQPNADFYLQSLTRDVVATARLISAEISAQR